MNPPTSFIFQKYCIICSNFFAFHIYFCISFQVSKSCLEFDWTFVGLQKSSNTASIQRNAFSDKNSRNYLIREHRDYPIKDVWETCGNYVGFSLTVTNNRVRFCVKVKVEYKPDIYNQLKKLVLGNANFQQGSLVCLFIPA